MRLDIAPRASFALPQDLCRQPFVDKAGQPAFVALLCMIGPQRPFDAAMPATVDKTSCLVAGPYQILAGAELLDAEQQAGRHRAAEADLDFVQQIFGAFAVVLVGRVDAGAQIRSARRDRDAVLGSS